MTSLNATDPHGDDNRVRVRYRRLVLDDVPELAKLHIRAFPGFFLSILGEPFLRQFYTGFVGDPTAITVVAVQGDRLHGAVVGTSSPTGFFARLLRRRLLPLILAGASASIRRPQAIRQLLRAARYRGEAGGPADGALLSSICVDPAARGRGVGAGLVHKWCDLAALAAPSAYLSTDAIDNDAANGFYRGLGWQLQHTYTTPEGRRMNRYVKRLEPIA